MSDLGTLLEQVFMNGLIERAWHASGGDVEAFKTEFCRIGEHYGYLFEVGDVEVVSGQPRIDWPCVHVPECDARRR